MTELSIQDVNALGNVLNSTFGKSSTPSTTHAISVKPRIVNEDTLLITYMTVVNFASYSNVMPQRREHEQDGIKVINECLRAIKAQFKEDTGKTISFKEKTREDSVEMLYSQPYVNQRKVCYFRVVAAFEFQIS